LICRAVACALGPPPGNKLTHAACADVKT
jgi:hypothetical protein